MKLIPLTRGMFAMVDDADYESLSKHKWYAKGCHVPGVFYAARWVTKKTLVQMHRVIMGDEPSVEVDHRDTNPLNNQRRNLRLCTRFQNCTNRRVSKGNKLGIKGVRWLDRNRSYQARISAHGRTIHVGLFKTIKQAVAARRKIGVKLHGEFFRQE